MLFSIDAVNAQGATLDLPLEDITDGFLVKEVEGLDPVKATIVSSSFALVDGEQYHSSRREKRNIVIKLGLEPNYTTSTVKELRNQLYGFFMPKSEVRLQFNDDTEAPVYIVGRVESCEAPVFAKEPEATISILCLESDFLALGSKTVTGATSSAAGEMEIFYEGTIETGFRFLLDVDHAIDSFTISHRAGTSVTSSLLFQTPLVAGDQVDINTETGNKGAMLYHVGLDVTTEESVLYAVSPTANWINLFPGSNFISVYAEGTAIPFSIEYTEKFGGL